MTLPYPALPYSAIVARQGRGRPRLLCLQQWLPEQAIPHQVQSGQYTTFLPTYHILILPPFLSHTHLPNCLTTCPSNQPTNQLIEQPTRSSCERRIDPYPTFVSHLLPIIWLLTASPPVCLSDQPTRSSCVRRMKRSNAHTRKCSETDSTRWTLITCITSISRSNTHTIIPSDNCFTNASKQYSPTQVDATIVRVMMHLT